MPEISQDRLVRKEVALGVIRELQPPMDHIGLRLAPFQSVQSDDVVFDFMKGLVDGIAPARAEDAEAEIADKDDFVGTGRASIIDWAIKDHYDPSDVSRFRESLLIGRELAGSSVIPRFVNSMTEDFQTKIARDQRLRRRKLDNRIEKLILNAYDLGEIAYDDGKIKFTVGFGRPANQQDEAPASSLWSAPTTADPIGDITAMQDFMWTTHSVRMTQAITSTKVIRNAFAADKFKILSPWGQNQDPRYAIPGWNMASALAAIEGQTGVRFIGGTDGRSGVGLTDGFVPGTYDSVYKTRALGSQTEVNNRFTRENVIIFLPSPQDIAAMDETQVGFGKTLTSPHPEGNWTPGFYEWEQEKVDPWSRTMGTGIKAFPVLPFMKYTYVMSVLA